MKIPLETYLEYLLEEKGLQNAFLYLNKDGREVCLRQVVIRIRLHTTIHPHEFLLKLWLQLHIPNQ